MQLSDAGNQVGARPAPNATTAPGYINNDLTHATAPTISDPDMANALLAEGENLTTCVGQALNKANVAQWMNAVNIKAAGGVAGPITANTTLNVYNAGLVLINASGGNIVITLCAAAAAAGTYKDTAGSNATTAVLTRLALSLVRTDTTTNTVTVDLAGSDEWQPGGLTSGLSLATGRTEIESDGVSGWYVRNQPRGQQYFSASGTFTVPIGVTSVVAEPWGGGGGGSGGSGASGAGGGYGRKRCAVTPGQSITVTVGAGGAAASSAGTAGNGGTSSFGSFVSATGGVGGAAGPGAGGSGSGGDINLSGGAGTDVTGSGDITYAVGGAAPMGGLGGTLNGSGLSLAATAPGGGGAANINVTAGQVGAAGGVNVSW